MLSAAAHVYGPCVTPRHPLTIGRTALLGAVLAAATTWLWVRDQEDGAVVLPLLVLGVGASLGYFLGLLLDREQRP